LCNYWDRSGELNCVIIGIGVEICIVLLLGSEWRFVLFNYWDWSGDLYCVVIGIGVEICIV
jgi:hypothetical protein